MDDSVTSETRTGREKKKKKVIAKGPKETRRPEHNLAKRASHQAAALNNLIPPTLSCLPAVGCLFETSSTKTETSRASRMPTKYIDCMFLERTRTQAAVKLLN